LIEQKFGKGGLALSESEIKEMLSKLSGEQIEHYIRYLKEISDTPKQPDVYSPAMPATA